MNKAVNCFVMGAVLLAASFVQGQNSCLVVSQKHNARIDSIGDVGRLRTHYSDRQLSKLAGKGVHVVSIPNAKQFVSASEVCGNSARIEMSLPVSQNNAVAYSQPEVRRCVEMVTHVDGSENCVTWTSLPSPQKQH